MKTLERYVFGSFLSSFTLAFLVLSFVLTIGLMVQIVGLILDGVSLSLVGSFAAVSFPETMQWTIPLALLVSGILVFSRLSADSEIAAMRACGVNLLSVVKWPVLFAFGCSLLGAWVNNEIVPRGHTVRRNLKAKVSVDTSLDVLEPGVWVDDFPKAKIYFAAREGNLLKDVRALDFSNPKISRFITAKEARVTEDGRDVVLDLRMMTVDPVDENTPGMMSVERYSYRIRNALKNARYTKKTKDLRFREILASIRDQAAEVARLKSAHADSGTIKAARRGLSRTKVELSKRFVFACASLCFVLVGIPLGIRAQRKESSIGMAISLAVALGYYLLVMLMLSLDRTYVIHPEILIWLPVLASLALGCLLIRKNL